MTADELIKLAYALGIDELFEIQPSGYTFLAVEALALLSARFRSRQGVSEISTSYNRPEQYISDLIDQLAQQLDEQWLHLIDWNPESLLHPSQLIMYARAIQRRGVGLGSLYGFVDGTVRRLVRPPNVRFPEETMHTRVFGSKFQALMLPNGVIGRLASTDGGDSMQTFSTFLFDQPFQQRDRALEIFGDSAYGAGPYQEDRRLGMFGDPAYGAGPHHLRGGATDVQAKHRALHVAVEEGFNSVASIWPFLNTGWNTHLYSSPMARYYRVGVLLVNCLNCLRPNQVAQFFDCSPPTLEDYLYHSGRRC